MLDLWLNWIFDSKLTKLSMYHWSYLTSTFPCFNTNRMWRKHTSSQITIINYSGLVISSRWSHRLSSTSFSSQAATAIRWEQRSHLWKLVVHLRAEWWSGLSVIAVVCCLFFVFVGGLIYCSLEVCIWSRKMFYLGECVLISLMFYGL